MTMTRVSTVFHLNLAYSSFEESQHSQVIEMCYWPLLQQAKERSIPLGLEATGYTLERIAELSPEWVEELRKLIAAGLVEFVGSGLTQMIGPLVPAKVTEANLRLGNEVYERLLGKRPDVAMLNEQVFSAGVLPMYRDAGYRAVVMEWENPASYNPQWPDQAWALPCEVAVPDGDSLPLIWNSSIVTQKLQRLAHADLTEEEYLAYVKTRIRQDGEALLLYGGDTEVFNHRSGRYACEAPMQCRDEWQVIFDAFDALRAPGDCSFVLPNELYDSKAQRITLQLETAAQPLPVKKQYKYNPTRWAVTGRDDLGMNTACVRLFQNLQHDESASPEAWIELCRFWASDYRTHITPSRWEAVKSAMQARLNSLAPREVQGKTAGDASHAAAYEEGRFLVMKAGSVTLHLNMRKGLAIDAAWFADVSDSPLFGSVPHGHFEDLALGADFFSGHLVLERAGHAKETDLEIVEPDVEVAADAIYASCSMKQFPVPLRKTVCISRLRPEVTVKYDFDWTMLNHCSLRLGFLTLLPSAFDADSLSYATHNGGRELELFPLNGDEVDHGQPVSSLVSARQCLGMTQGKLWIGDSSTQLEIEVDRAQAAAVPMILHKKASPDYLFRCLFSLRETDETSRMAQEGGFEGMGGFTMTIKARKATSGVASSCLQSLGEQ
tara:strand:- start:19841 stop:21835 length:1995 start_codon:yes stop_codon:yes gene_type:complete